VRESASSQSGEWGSVRESGCWDLRILIEKRVNVRESVREGAHESVLESA
jgi:hypothetical protein